MFLSWSLCGVVLLLRSGTNTHATSFFVFSNFFSVVFFFFACTGFRLFILFLSSFSILSFDFLFFFSCVTTGATYYPMYYPMYYYSSPRFHSFSLVFEYRIYTFPPNLTPTASKKKKNVPFPLAVAVARWRFSSCRCSRRGRPTWTWSC